MTNERFTRAAITRRNAIALMTGTAASLSLGGPAFAQATPKKGGTLRVSAFTNPSSLDPATEAAVERALAAVAEGRTVVTIAHRLSTAERADRVAVMEHGRLVEVASHDELVEQGDRYARLWQSWQAGLAAGA